MIVYNEELAAYVECKGLLLRGTEKELQWQPLSLAWYASRQSW